MKIIGRNDLFRKIKKDKLELNLSFVLVRIVNLTKEILVTNAFIEIIFL